MTINSTGELAGNGVSTAAPYAYRDSLTQLEMIGDLKESVSTWQSDIDTLQDSLSGQLSNTLDSVSESVASMSTYVDAMEERMTALIRRGAITGLYNDPTDRITDKPINIVLERIYMFNNVHALFAYQYGLELAPTASGWDERRDTCRDRDTGMTEYLNNNINQFPVLITH